MQIGFPDSLVVKNSPAEARDTGDAGSMPGSGRFPEGGNGNPLQYSCLGIPWTEEPGRLHTVHGVSELDETKHTQKTQTVEPVIACCENSCKVLRIISTPKFTINILLFQSCPLLFHCCSSVTQSIPTLYDPMDCRHTRLPCPSPPPGACSNSCPLSRWCHPTISSPVAPFSSCLQLFPASEAFPVSQLFTSGGQSIGASASASVLPLNIQGRFPSGLTGLISLLSKELSRVFSSTTVWKHQYFGHSAFFMVQLSHPYMTTGKTIAFTIQTFVSKIMSLLFNTLSSFVIAVPPRSKHLLISWLRSPSVVSLGPPRIKSTTVSPSIPHEVIGLDAMILVFECWALS